MMFKRLLEICSGQKPILVSKPPKKHLSFWVNFAVDLEKQGEKNLVFVPGLIPAAIFLKLNVNLITLRFSYCAIVI
ncbi:hypothetical protein ACE1CI_08360 [Aerosakkonemataceae cyanobacterium BLCC-F50]|uniref:Uncharacterized protein n=1 Tax=Floridaenema flaviceps BLCC-F50 TaxID=3153642 RepID=A0ABV4XMJ7_9CYAN